MKILNKFTANIKVLNKAIESIQENENFNKWFGDSKVVDKDGNPLVVYHGTNEKFDEFNLSDGGIWFTKNIDSIKDGSSGASGNTNIISVYLSASNLAGWDEYDKYDFFELKDMGYDGVILDDDYVVFDPNQIKSATNNNGNFSLTSNKITEGKLSKEQYDYRRESAAKRNLDNNEIAIENGMTEEQAELISELCSLRHDFHSNLDSIVKSDESGYKKDLVELNSKLNDEDIAMSFIPVDTTDYIDIDSIDELKSYGEAPDVDNEDEYQEWYDETYPDIYSELEQLNKKIENYLADIDKKYGTSYAPTGFLRRM